MTSTVSTLAAWLGRFEAFKALDPADLNWLASRAEPFHCGVGQELLSADRLPEYCYAVVEGKGRVLLLRCAAGPLAYSQPGDLVGWAGLAALPTLWWVTAVSSLKLIGIKAMILRT